MKTKRRNTMKIIQNKKGKWTVKGEDGETRMDLNRATSLTYGLWDPGFGGAIWHYYLIRKGDKWLIRGELDARPSLYKEAPVEELIPNITKYKGDVEAIATAVSSRMDQIEAKTWPFYEKKVGPYVMPD